MKAIVYERNGSPDVLQYKEVTEPEISDDDVLVRTYAVSVEGGDLIGRAKVPPPTVPHIGGYQRAGIIEAIGSNVEGLQIGQRVVAFNWSGAYAELSCVPAHYVYPIPEGLSFIDAVAIPVTFGTAAQAILKHNDLSSGETILITGASGGVGLAAVQLAKKVGAEIIGTSSSDEYLKQLKQYGMDFGINYKTEDIGNRCREITNGRGVDLVMDNVGGKTIPAILQAVSDGGRISVVGTASDPTGSKYNAMKLIGKQLSLKGTFFGKDMHRPATHEMINKILIDVSAGRYSMPIDREYSLRDAADAHRYIESDSSIFGRVILTVP